jgi:hypothetical protein
VDSNPALGPSLVLMPESSGSAEEGAPAVFYGGVNADVSPVTIGYYDGAAWQQRGLTPELNTLLNPHCFWLEDAGEGLLVAYDPASGGPVQMYCNQYWMPIIDYPVGGPAGGVLSAMDVDYHAASGTIGIIAHYNTAGGQVIRVSTGSHEQGWQHEDVTPTGDQVPGLAIGFSPDGTPWAFYTHGTIDTSETIILDFDLEIGTYTGGSWNFVTSSHDGEPLSLDLSFTPEGNPQLAFVSARDFNLSIPFVIDITATLYYDAVYAVNSGSAWSYTDIFTSSVSPDFFGSKITLDVAADVAFTSPEQVVYANIAGDILFSYDADADPAFQITGGELANDTISETQAGGDFSPDGYFTGTPGVGFSWQESTQPSCAYSLAEQVDITELLGGEVNLENELLYWSPAL